MQQYQRFNILTGWLAFAASLLVYTLTVEPTASLWDCSEFIAVSYKLEVPHPPGAPLFLLLGRFFSMFATSTETVALAVNMLSVLASAFTILFLFWSITMVARKMFGLNKPNSQPTIGQTVMIMGGAFIGAMAYTFSDSFWFSAVEAEVYALSSFFTAIVFWAILKWELIDDPSKGNRWLILIAYLMGLSIGVHLLNLVTIPALALIYYFKKYKQTTPVGILVSLLIGGIAIVLIQNGVIIYLPVLSGQFEILFVNSFGLPFGSGIVFFVALLLGALVWGIRFSTKKKMAALNTILLAFTFILIGYTSYATVVIRSNANPPIDENNPENVISFVSYLKREQYGQRPLLHGQYYTAQLVDQKRGKAVYVKGEDKYIPEDFKIVNKWDPAHSTILPRMWSSRGDHKETYRLWTGNQGNDKPSFVDNIGYMLRYQMGFMYWRYFLWNYVGRESDIQNAGVLGPFEAFEEVPAPLKNNKGRNAFFALPLLLGLLGLVFQLFKDIKGFGIVALLFFLTGLALILYLNSPPNEPRERDYIYVGSTYAFAMWIGLGVMAIATFFKQKLVPGVVATAICLVVPGIMAAEGWDDHDRSNRYFSVDAARNYLASCAPNAILFTGGDNDTFPLWYVQEVEGFRTDVRVIVQSFFNTDWYIDQLREKRNLSEGVPFSLERKHYRQGGANDYLRYFDRGGEEMGALSLTQYIELVRKESKVIRASTQLGNETNVLPSKAFYLDVDLDRVNQLGIVPENLKGQEVPRMVFGLRDRKDAIDKKDLMTLDLIVNNNWERPIYFNNTSLMGLNIDLSGYVVQEGITQRLLPVRAASPQGSVNIETMYENMMTKFAFRELDNPNVHYNEDYRGFVASHRRAFNVLAEALFQANDRERATEVLLTSLEKIPGEAVPFEYASIETVALLMELDQKDKGLEVGSQVADMLLANLEFVTSSTQNYRTMSIELQRVQYFMSFLISTFSRAGFEEKATEIKDRYEQITNEAQGRLRASR